MSATTLEEIRAKVAAAIANLSGWRQSPYPWPMFPADSGLDQHQSFAVGVVESSPVAPVESSRILRPVAGVHVTRLSVRWLSRIRLDGALSDYSAALASAITVRSALATLCAGSASGPPGGRVVLTLAGYTGPQVAAGAVASQQSGSYAVLSEQALDVFHQLATTEA